MNVLPILPGLPDYGSASMADRAMISFLARVAKDARRRAGIKPARVAVAIDVDPSTIYRFERGLWPHDADFILTGYSEELQIEPVEFWRRALKLWEEDEDAGPSASVQ